LPGILGLGVDDPIMKTALPGRLIDRAGRFVNRHVLGLQTDPDFLPQPSDCASIPVPLGFSAGDDAGPVWILDKEYLPAWHHRRTVVGAQAYRFEYNEEYDCGWRLADVAARFLRMQVGGDDPAIVTIVPPPAVYAPVTVLPWLGTRLSQLLNLRFAPALFDVACPLHAHPDTIRHPRLPLSEVFRISGEAGVDLEGQRVLLIDWRYHQGRTLSTLARLLRRRKAEVVRFAWLR
jgi:hypothetical protein